MEAMLTVGVIMTAGYLLGEAAERLKLPRVTGYIIAGILLNPGLMPIVPQEFPEHTDLVTNIALAFISFSVGGTLAWKKIRTLGRSLACVAVFEAETAFLFVAVGFALLAPFVVDGGGLAAVPLALLLASLAAPTDPSATLAVVHEYDAKGEVTDTVLGAAAFDDALGILNYTFAVAVALMLVGSGGGDVPGWLEPVRQIGLSALSGIAMGLLLTGLLRLLGKEGPGKLIALALGAVVACFGTAQTLGSDPLLACMFMGATLINAYGDAPRVFSVLEDDAEELIFVLFFTLSAMHLELDAVRQSLLAIVVFAVLRTAGKFAGVAFGGWLGGSPREVKRYAAGGLLPSGGVVIGLALLMRSKPGLENLAPLVISIIIGASVVHEILGPIASKLALKKAGEI